MFSKTDQVTRASDTTVCFLENEPGSNLEISRLILSNSQSPAELKVRCGTKLSRWVMLLLNCEEQKCQVRKVTAHMEVFLVYLGERSK